MAKLRLGDLLIRAGVLTDSQLRIALATQKQHGGKLGEHLVRTNLVSEQQIAIAVAEQLGILYNDCTQAHASQFSSLVPQKIAEQLQALPVRIDEATDTLHVAVADPLDEQVPMQLARLTGKRVELQVAPKALLRQAIKVAYADIELHDEGTSEFQLVDIAGREGKMIKVHSGDHDELPEASVLDLDPVSDAPDNPFPLESHSQAPAQRPQQMARNAPTPLPGTLPKRISPAPAAAKAPPRPGPPAVQSQQHDSGEEAMRMLWALSDILIEKGYLSRSELMAKLRGK